LSGSRPGHQAAQTGWSCTRCRRASCRTTQGTPCAWRGVCATSLTPFEQQAFHAAAPNARRPAAS